MLNRILVAIDYSDRSRHALDEAIELAKLTNAEIMLIHVLSAMDQDYPVRSSYPITDVGYADSALYEEMMQRYAQQWQRFEQEHLQILQSFARDVEAQGVHTNWTQVYGDAGKEICQTAQNWQADLIILGRRGRTGLKEALLGSVSNYVMHYAPCTVMIVQDQTDSGSELAKQREMLVI